MSAIGNVVPITMISRLIGFRDSNLDELWRSAVHMTKLVGSTLTLDELDELRGRWRSGPSLDRRSGGCRRRGTE